MNENETKHSNNTSTAKFATPLWIIGLFVGVSEIIAGVTVINTTGLAQLISLVFMCFFTTAVAATFFAILWNRSEVFFSPMEFAGVDIETFVSHVGSNRNERERNIVESVTEKIRANLIEEFSDNMKNGTNVDSERITDLLDDVNSSFIDIIFRKSDFPEIGGDEIKISLYDTEWPNVSTFLNDVYFSASGAGVKLPVYTYGKFWHLRNLSTNRVLEKSSKGDDVDNRVFSSLNVGYGDVLLAERVQKKS